MINFETIELIALLNELSGKAENEEDIKDFRDATIINWYRCVFYDRNKPLIYTYKDGETDIEYPVVKTMIVDRHRQEIMSYYENEEYDIRVAFNDDGSPHIIIRIRESDRSILITCGKWIVL